MHRARPPRRWRLGLAFVVLIGATAGCGGDGDGDDGVQDLDAAREMWAASDVTRYSVDISFWNILGGRQDCPQMIVEGTEVTVYEADVRLNDECTRLAVVPNLFDYVDEHADDRGTNYAEFDDENGHVILVRTAWDSCTNDACSEVFVRLFPYSCGSNEPCEGTR